jgi:hypothetical protein
MDERAVGGYMWYMSKGTEGARIEGSNRANTVVTSVCKANERFGESAGFATALELLHQLYLRTCERQRARNPMP